MGEEFEFSFKLNHPLTEEDWDKLMDTELEQCTEVVFHTKKGKEVVFIKKGELDGNSRCIQP